MNRWKRLGSLEMLPLGGGCCSDFGSVTWTHGRQVWGPILDKPRKVSTIAAQIVQREPGRLDMHIVTLASRVDHADMEAIAAAATLRLGARTAVRIHSATTVPYPSATKHRFVRRLFELSR